MLSVLRLRLIIHLDVSIVAFNFFIVLEAKEILQLWEVLLMSRHEIIDIVNGILAQNIIFRSNQVLICKLGLGTACQKEHFVDISKALQVLAIILEHLEDFSCQLCIQSETSQFLVLCVSLSAIFIVEIVKASIFLL